MPKPPTPSGHHRKPTRPPTPNKQNQPRDHKQRAIQLIGKYAGPHWREAQRAKWVIDMVTAIHTQYARGEEEQTNHIAAMQAELSRAYRIMHENDQEHTREIADLAERLNQTRIGEVEANQKALAAQTRMDALAVRLEAAEGAAEAARAECDQVRDCSTTLTAGRLDSWDKRFHSITTIFLAVGEGRGRDEGSGIPRASEAFLPRAPPPGRAGRVSSGDS